MISRNLRGWRVGESHQRAKLTNVRVKRMRAANEKGIGYVRLSAIFQCGESTVRDVCTYRTWRHVL